MRIEISIYKDSGGPYSDPNGHRDPKSSHTDQHAQSLPSPHRPQSPREPRRPLSRTGPTVLLPEPSTDAQTAHGSTQKVALCTCARQAGRTILHHLAPCASVAVFEASSRLQVCAPCGCVGPIACVNALGTEMEQIVIPAARYEVCSQSCDVAPMPTVRGARCRKDAMRAGGFVGAPAARGTRRGSSGVRPSIGSMMWSAGRPGAGQPE